MGQPITGFCIINTQQNSPPMLLSRGWETVEFLDANLSYQFPLDFKVIYF
jgi:hypothetical protein